MNQKAIAEVGNQQKETNQKGNLTNYLKKQEELGREP